MKDWKPKIEIAANIAIVVVAVLLGVVLIKQGFFSTPAKTKADLRVPDGTKLSLPHTEWEKTRKTVLLVLSKNCDFCSTGAPFYQKISAAVTNRTDVRLIAVLPESPAEGREYLDKLQVQVGEVRQASLDSIGVKATPTLLVINDLGMVTASYVGLLQEDKQTEILNLLKPE